MSLQKLQDEILVVDLESTCWEGGPPPAGETSDIIEIGVAHLDVNDLAVTRNWGTYVIPIRSTITPFSTSINHIDNETIKMLGVPIADAFSMLEREKSRQRTWASWGNYDRKKMEDDARELKISHKMDIRYPMAPRHINVKTLFAIAYALPAEVSMDKALARMGWELKGKHHSGKDDAYNIARILGHILGVIRLPGGKHT
jgi:inhibitor of KinA sporulation pathway (predicted exonuclease)